MKIAIFTLCLFFTLINFANAGDIYNCIDRDGKSIFTDTPQDGMNCKSQNDNSIDTSLKEQAQWENNRTQSDQSIGNKKSKSLLEMPSFDCYKESYNNMKSMDKNCFSSLINEAILKLSKDCQYQFRAFQWFQQIKPNEGCQQEFKVALQEKFPKCNNVIRHQQIPNAKNK